MRTFIHVAIFCLMSAFPVAICHAKHVATGDAATVNLLKQAINYTYGWDGAEKNLSTAFKLYLQAADNGEPFAEACLAECYRYGFYGTVEVDKEESIYWYKRSADHGNPDAVKILSDMGISYTPKKKYTRDSGSDISPNTAPNGKDEKSSHSNITDNNENTSLSVPPIISTSEFREVTETFFKTPKTYSVSNFCIIMLGMDGYTRYEEGESTFTVKKNECLYILGDDSEESISFSPALKNVTVLTGHGDVEMQMFITNDGGAIRAIQFEDGKYIVHYYVRNINTGKYVSNHFFTLR